MTLRDKFFRPSVASSMMSPSAAISAIALGAAGFAASGGNIAGAIIGLVLGWLGRVGIAVGAPDKGAKPRTRIDPFTLDEPWRRVLQQALASRTHFNTAMGKVAPGPTKERLATIATSMDAAVDEAWQTARAGHQLADALRRVDAKGARQQLDALRDAPSSPGVDAQIAALEARVASGQRMAESIDTTRDRLTVLNARLDESVTTCIELSIGAFQPEAFSAVENNLANVTTELEALRAALASLPGETGQATA